MGGKRVAVTSAADSSAPVTPVHIEVGDIAVSSNWVRVTFAEPYTQPIVVTGPPHLVDLIPARSGSGMSLLGALIYA